VSFFTGRRVRAPFAFAVGALLSLALEVVPSAGAAPCPGDCNSDGSVTVDELISAVNIALGNVGVAVCPEADANADGGVSIDELITAANNALNRCPAAATATPTETGSPAIASVTPTATATVPSPIPTAAAALLAWLEAGHHLVWMAESAPHPSAGPHFGFVRTFLNPTVFASLAAAQTAHPVGSALVKELYGTGSQVRGWSVMVKVQDDSAGGEGWYWFERFDGTTFASGFGIPGCSACHSAGSDFVRSPFPLQ
jgi:hypothetical protein